jgi:endonuclease YncB( thermonuclease family)
VVPAGGVVAFEVVGDDGGVVRPISEYLRDFKAGGHRDASVRSYAHVLLRWWRFLQAIGVGWDRAAPADRRDFVLWLQQAPKPISHRRTRSAARVGTVNPVTGKQHLTDQYAPRTVRHSNAVLRAFSEFWIEEGAGPLVNPVPVDLGRSGRAHPHHNVPDALRSGWWQSGVAVHQQVVHWPAGGMISRRRGANMIEPVQIFWAPAAASMPALGARALVDITDGDTPNLRMPVRMLSVDTPEVTARTAGRAAEIDQEFKQLAQWIRQGKAPIEPGLAEFLLPKLETGRAGSLHFEQGQAASAFGKQNITTRLARPSGRPRGVFIRVADTPFDNNHRLLAYLAPDHSQKERRELPKAQRPTFNLDLVAAGWAAPFVIYPSIPGANDLALLIDAAQAARSAGFGIWSDPDTLLAYEYRAMEKLFAITRTIVNPTGSKVDARSWRQRYCADMRSRILHGPEDYVAVPQEYRLWIWPQDVNQAVARLNLTPAPALVAAG